jgi:hypothetical protein
MILSVWEPLWNSSFVSLYGSVWLHTFSKTSAAKHKRKQYTTSYRPVVEKVQVFLCADLYLDNEFLMYYIKSSNDQSSGANFCFVLQVGTI